MISQKIKKSSILTLKLIRIIRVNIINKNYDLIHLLFIKTTILQKINEGRLADVIILCTGASSAVDQAFRSIDRGGTILFFAVTDKNVSIPLDPNKMFWRTELTLTSSYAGAQEDYAKALELIHLKKISVKDMITHEFTLEKIGEAFKIVSEAEDSLKVLIKPH